jgi:predicted ATPase/DNA-binding CsgD family transcriptional regulator
MSTEPSDRSQPVPVPLRPYERRRSLGAALPHPLTSFIGREREAADLRGLLLRDDVRLVTLTGPGGVGKTRLALRVAAEIADEFADGVAFVGLAAIRDAELVLTAIGRGLGLRETDGSPLAERLRAFLQDRELFVVIDNFEHVLLAAPWLTEFLAACERLKFLVTSRAALRLSGEHTFLVPPLALPGPGHVSAPEELRQTEAVRLFEERARATRADFAVTAVNAGSVAEICRRLDGLPLAIELAAARVALLSPASLVAALEPRLPLLTSGPRDVPDRLQTMRNAIAWSYDLLSPDLQLLFRRLSVFAGGFDVEAAEAVCASDELRASSLDREGPNSKLEALDGIAALVDQSLVRRQEYRHLDPEEPEPDDAVGPRFGMLEMIREYGLERLDAGGEAEAVRRAHGEYFLSLAERADAESRGPREPAWLDRLEIERDNLSAALAWATERGEPTPALRLAAALGRFWDIRGHVREGSHWLEQALAAADGVPGAIRARAMAEAGLLAARLCDFDRAAAHLEAALALSREVGDRRGEALALNFLGALAFDRGDYERSRELHGCALELARSIGDERAAARALQGLAQAEVRTGNPTAAEAAFAECLSVARALGDEELVASGLDALGIIASEAGNPAKSILLHEESLALRRRLRDQRGIAISLYNLGVADLALLNAPRCASLFEEAARRFEALGDARIQACAMINLGQAAMLQGDHARTGALNRDALRLFRALGDRRLVALATCNVADSLKQEGDYPQAAAQLAEGIAEIAQVKDLAAAAEATEFVAELAEALAEPAAAARLFGAAEALRAATHARRLPQNEAEYERRVEATRAALGRSATETAWSAGRLLTAEQAIAEAIAVAQHLSTLRPVPARAETPASGLTPREREVLRLLVRGLTDREIAAALSLSPRTASNHVLNILAKLDAETRTAAAIHAVRHGLV